MIRSVAFDQDGVLADFSGAVWRQFLRQEPPPVYCWDFVPDWVWDRLTVDFWGGLDPIPEGLRLLRGALARGLDVFVVTSPPRSKIGECVTGKVLWLQKHLPELNPRTTHFSVEKWRMARPDTLLVDDRPENCHQWAARGGPTLLYPAPYNAAAGIDPKTLEIPNEDAIVDNRHLRHRPHPHAR